jgi:hypothetical protein
MPHILYLCCDTLGRGQIAISDKHFCAFGRK